MPKSQVLAINAFFYLTSSTSRIIDNLITMTFPIDSVGFVMVSCSKIWLISYFQNAFVKDSAFQTFLRKSHQLMVCYVIKFEESEHGYHGGHLGYKNATTLGKNRKITVFRVTRLKI